MLITNRKIVRRPMDERPRDGRGGKDPSAVTRELGVLQTKVMKVVGKVLN